MKRLILLILLLISNVAVAAENDDGASNLARAKFKEAYAALTAGQRTKAETLISGLEDYPLYIYYRYYTLSRRLHAEPKEKVREFLHAYDDSMLASRLRAQWLKLLSRTGRWQDFLHDYRPQDDTKLKCAQITARIKTGALEGVSGDARALWLVGKSQPKECDPAFDFLKSSNLMTDQLIWQRIQLAFSNNKPSLARYLARSLKEEPLRLAAERWHDAHVNPTSALNHVFFKRDERIVREIFVHAIARIARRDVAKAIAKLRQFEKRYVLNDEESGRIKQRLAIAAASQKNDDRITLLDDVPPAHVDDTVEKYRIRSGIEEAAWEQLARWTEHDPIGSTSKLRWRYWRARSLQQIGESEKANLIFQELSLERDYYGFLSADQLNLPYQMNYKPILASEAELAATLARPGILRARELFHLDMPFKARREWHYEISRLTERELEIAAYIVNRWGWYDRAIFALGSAKSYDDLHIRFPLLHEDLVRKYSQKRKLDPAILYSIIRTESAFMDDARSPAGALGLMQVMPRTGRETARRIGAKFSSAKVLMNPTKNVMIGSAYLKQMIDRFGGSFSMAAAAYNAGPHRVKKWLPDSDCVPADRWIDTIPFTETRKYVRRATFYAVVYQWRLNEQSKPISARLTDVSPQGAIQQC